MKKRILAGIMGIIMAAGMLTACGGDATVKEFKNFVGKEMTEATAKYAEIKTAVEAWEGKEEAEISEDIEKLSADIDATKEKVENIVLENEEVIAIRDTFTNALNECKAGFEHFKQGVETEDEELKALCKEKLENAENLIKEYEAAIAEFAESKGIKLGK